MPISTAPYKRSYAHTKTRGREEYTFVQAVLGSDMWLSLEKALGKNISKFKNSSFYIKLSDFMKVIDTKPVGMPEAKKVMASREKDKELTYEQKLALEHLKKFTKLKPTEAKNFLEELSGVLRMSEETKIQILNLLPKTPDELRMIFTREKFSLKDEEIKKILELIKKYQK